MEFLTGVWVWGCIQEQMTQTQSYINQDPLQPGDSPQKLEAWDNLHDFQAAE